MENNKHILILGGNGAMGTYLTPLLASQGGGRGVLHFS